MRPLRFAITAASLIAVLSAGIAPNCFSTPGAPTAIVQDSGRREIQRVFDAWLAALRTGTSTAILKLYAKDAILLPTLSPVIANTPALRKAYFDVLTAKKDLQGKVDKEYIRVYGDIAVNTGLYTFSYTENKAIVIIPARFSFVYRKFNEGWLIIDHHSSKLPEKH